MNAPTNFGVWTHTTISGLVESTFYRPLFLRSVTMATAPSLHYFHSLTFRMRLSSIFNYELIKGQFLPGQITMRLYTHTTYTEGNIGMVPIWFCRCCCCSPVVLNQNTDQHSFCQLHPAAATTMCEYARRLCNTSNQTESVPALLNAACSAYLAAINALHLAGPQYTWVTITTMDTDSEEV